MKSLFAHVFGVRVELLMIVVQNVSFDTILSRVGLDVEVRPDSVYKQ